MAYQKAVVIQLPKAVMPIVGVNILFFLLQQFVPSFTSVLILNTATVFSHPWTLLTSMFLHANFTHILFNMYALIMFGPLVENKIGTRRFIVLYFLSGILAALGYVFFQEAILGVTAQALGASGAIMGVLGMTIMMFPQLRVLFFFFIPMSMRTAGIIFALVDFIGVFNPSSHVANIAHLVGLGIGLLYGVYLRQKGKKFQKTFARPYDPVAAAKKATRKTSSRSSKKRDKADIELTQDDIDNYLKYGKL